MQTSTNRADRHHYGRRIVCIDLVQASPEFRVQAIFNRILHRGQHYEVSGTQIQDDSCQLISRIAYWHKRDVQKLGGRFGRAVIERLTVQRKQTSRISQIPGGCRCSYRIIRAASSLPSLLLLLRLVPPPSLCPDVRPVIASIRRTASSIHRTPVWLFVGSLKVLELLLTLFWLASSCSFLVGSSAAVGSSLARRAVKRTKACRFLPLNTRSEEAT